MLAVQLLNDAPQLNSYFIIGAETYVSGETVTINFQLLDQDSNIRFIPPSAAIVTCQFKNSDATTLSLTATKLFPSDDRSILQVVISSSQSANVIGSNFQISVDMLGDGTNIQIAIASNVLSKTFFDGDC